MNWKNDEEYAAQSNENNEDVPLNSVSRDNVVSIKSGLIHLRAKSYCTNLEFIQMLKMLHKTCLQ